MPANLPGIFVTLEGPDGAGKSTQLKLLCKYLEGQGVNPVVSRDPGGTALGRQIRRLLLNPELFVSPVCELLLYQADRAQHVSEVIMPALKEGKLVICDRFTDSTCAYQGFGRGIDMALINQLNQIATSGLKPDLTILFDIESEVGLSRLHPGGQDRLEREALAFHQKVRQGYLKLAEAEPDRFVIIDATRPFSLVQEDLQKIFATKVDISKISSAKVSN
jgi:dTMP kinase